MQHSHRVLFLRARLPAHHRLFTHRTINHLFMKKSLLSCVLLFIILTSQSQVALKDSVSLRSGLLQIVWSQQKDGWHISQITAGGKVLTQPSGAYTLIYLNRKPAGNLVDLDLEGKDFSFYPTGASRMADGSLTFKQSLRFGNMEAHWKIDPAYPTDIQVEIIVSATAKGFYSIASPTIAAIDPNNLSWGMIPGNWYGRALENDFQLATKYSMGLPSVPYLAKERNTMTLCPLLTTKDKITIAVIPEPGTATEVWEGDSSTRNQNKVGMSTMNRHNELSPTAYAPVLGQTGSYLQAGQTVAFKFRYSIQSKDWFPVFSHAVNDVYRFPKMLDIQESKRSLSQRVGLMQIYLRDAKKSNWSTWTSKGYTIGATGVKNADVGAMCMIANAGKDSVLMNRLPFVRNYKLAMQQMEPGFFQGAGMGEYADEDGVESERGNYVEPLFTTYYTLMDMGNMLLFKPNDPLLKERVKMAADKLIAWQHPDGGWDVAYDRFSYKVTFPDIKDLRPTWYGLLIAYRITGEDVYLEAAKKGADWLIKNGVDKGHYLGVCGDARNIWDFATAQCSQAFLDLYNITKEENYKRAAIDAAEIYATSIFTQPIATTKMKSAGGVKRQDWEISQAGLSVEHIRGTAGGGPILISSFAGLFVRVFEMTSDSIFLYMARCAARGRDAYVDENGQSIYYWSGMETVAKSAKVFPHHAYWQIGWITDYLLSEARLRSGGKVQFPGGFMTPKVGPHISYGFEPGTIYSSKANLLMPSGLISSNNTNLEYTAALSVAGDKLFVTILNQAITEQTGTLTIDLSKVNPGQAFRWQKETALQGKIIKADRNKNCLEVKMPAWGMTVVAIDLSKR
jgi:hypothetical protein